MNNVLKARSNFPHISSGKIYYNHAATGPVSRSVREKLIEIITEKSESNIDEFQKFIKTAAETKSLLAEMINTEAERIAFVDNTSNGINILAQGIDWKPGDRILLNDLEFPANVYPFLNLKKEGVEIDFVKSRGGIVTSGDIIEGIKSGTRLISVSQVQFLTGYRADLYEIGKTCKEKGIIFSVDAIQGLGAVKLDAARQNIDFISSGSQKWLLGLQGFIYVSEELQRKLNPRYVGWLSMEDAWNLLDYNFKLKSSAECFQTGTVNTLGVYALNTSLKFFKEFGYDYIEERIIENSIYLIKKLKEIGLQPVLENISAENLAGIVSFKHPVSKKIFENLLKEDIVCSVREGMIRFSPHFYNISEESDKIVEIMSGMLK